jgi:transcriptional regulator with XRE-family HTH domain
LPPAQVEAVVALLRPKPQRTNQGASMPAAESLSSVVRGRLGRESIRSIGAKTGIARSTLSRFRRGDRDITVRTLSKLLPVLGLRLVEAAADENDRAIPLEILPNLRPPFPAQPAAGGPPGAVESPELAGDRGPQPSEPVAMYRVPGSPPSSG